VLVFVQAQGKTGGEGATTKKVELTKQQLERQKNRRMLVSCLTLVRSLYSTEEKQIQDFVMAHPTQHKERLMNKILSQMMIYCREHISDQQVEELQQFKDSSADFDWSRPDYKTLLNFDLNKYKVDENLPKEKQEAPVDMSQAEAAMQTIVEDLSEEMKREREDEMRGRGNAPSIFFMDLQNLTGFTALLYVAGIIGFFAIVFYALINKILAKPVDFNRERREKISQKKSSSTGKKTQ